MNQTRRALLGASAALAGITVAPSARAAADPTTLRLALAARGYRTLDPAVSIQGADNWSIAHIHDTLVSSPDGSFALQTADFVPKLAQSWTMSADAKTWTFKLREGVAFHKNYGEMTADDVVFTLDRLVDPNQPGTNKVLYRNIARSTAIGRYTVEVILKQPDPLFLHGAIQDSSCSIMSRKAVQEKGAAIAQDPIGTGPYQLAGIDPDPSRGITMDANPAYFGGTPKIGRLQILYILDTTARTVAVLSGNVHMIEGVRAPGWAAGIQARKNTLQFDIAAPGSLFTLSFNLTRKPLDNLKVRQAFAYGIDRDTIAKAMAPFGQRIYGLNPPGYPGGYTTQDVPPELRYQYDPAKARALLKDAGFPTGLAIDAFTSQREDYSAVMLIVQEQMRKVGLNINLQVIDHTTFHANNQKDMNSLPQNSNAYPPVPALPLDAILSRAAEVKADGNGGANYAHYGVVIPGIDDLLAAAPNEADAAKRLEIIRQAERKVMTDLPLLPIGTNGYMIVRDPRVTLGFDVKSGYAYWRLDRARIG